MMMVLQILCSLICSLTGWGRLTGVVWIPYMNPLRPITSRQTSAISFINRVGSGSGTCDRPVLSGTGYQKATLSAVYTTAVFYE